MKRLLLTLCLSVFGVASLLAGNYPQRSDVLWVTVPDHADRSIMNVCFVMKEEYSELEADFIRFCADRGIVGIKGHRSVGGFRASLYNALPIESVKVLVEAMHDFEATR